MDKNENKEMKFWKWFSILSMLSAITFMITGMIVYNYNEHLGILLFIGMIVGYILSFSGMIICGQEEIIYKMINRR